MALQSEEWRCTRLTFACIQLASYDSKNFFLAGSTRTPLDSRHYGILFEQLDSSAIHWEKIGMALGFLCNEIHTIRSVPMNVIVGPRGCLSEIVSRWLCWAPGDSRGSKDFATLEALKEAVTKADLAFVADRLILRSSCRGVSHDEN